MAGNDSYVAQIETIKELTLAALSKLSLPIGVTQDPEALAEHIGKIYKVIHKDVINPNK